MILRLLTNLPQFRGTILFEVNMEFGGMITDPNLKELYEAVCCFIGFYIFAMCLFMIRDWMEK